MKEAAMRQPEPEPRPLAVLAARRVGVVAPFGSTFRMGSVWLMIGKSWRKAAVAGRETRVHGLAVKLRVEAVPIYFALGRLKRAALGVAPKKQALLA